MYGYQWTNEYGIFRLTIDARLQKEIRPVFHEELDFFGMDEYFEHFQTTWHTVLHELNIDLLISGFTPR